MQDRYSRNIPAISEEDQIKLNSARVFIAGMGGLGGYVFELLLRIGVGALVIADDDAVETSNLNRQLLSCESNIGMSKIAAAGERADDINSGAVIIAHNIRIDASSAAALIKDCDVVIDCLDNYGSRRALAEACFAENIPDVFGAVCGWESRLCVLRRGKGELLANIIMPQDITNETTSVISPTVSYCASMQAAECVKILTNKPVLKESQLLISDLLSGDRQIIDCV